VVAPAPAPSRNDRLEIPVEDTSQLEVLPGVVHEELPGPHDGRHLHRDLEVVEVVEDAHVVSVPDAPGAGILGAHPHDRLAPLLLQHAPVVSPRRVDAPAGVAAAQRERVAPSGRRRVLVGRELLSHLQVEILVQVELDPSREGRIGLLVDHVVGERRDRVVGPDLGRGSDGDDALAHPAEAGPAALLELAPVDLPEVARQLDQGTRDLVVVGGTELAAGRERVVQTLEAPLAPGPVPELRDAPGRRPCIDGPRQERADLPVRLRLIEGRRLLAGVDERHEGRHPLVLGPLVPGGDR
jgi:hypothetical protein